MYAMIAVELGARGEIFVKFLRRNSGDMAPIVVKIHEMCNSDTFG